MGKGGVKGCGLRKGEGGGFLGRCDVGVGRVVRGMEGGMKGEGGGISKACAVGKQMYNRYSGPFP